MIILRVVFVMRKSKENHNLLFSKLISSYQSIASNTHWVKCCTFHAIITVIANFRKGVITLPHNLPEKQFLDQLKAEIKLKWGSGLFSMSRPKGVGQILGALNSRDTPHNKVIMIRDIIEERQNAHRNDDRETRAIYAQTLQARFYAQTRIGLSRYLNRDNNFDAASAQEPRDDEVKRPGARSEGATPPPGAAAIAERGPAAILYPSSPPLAQAEIDEKPRLSEVIGPQFANEPDESGIIDPQSANESNELKIDQPEGPEAANKPEGPEANNLSNIADEQEGPNVIEEQEGPEENKEPEPARRRPGR